MHAIPIAQGLIGILQVYLLIGLIFAIPFLLFFVQRIDHSAQGSTWGFKILALPGVMLFWPLLLFRLIRGREKPIECNAHRICSPNRVIKPRANTRIDEAKL